MLADRMTGLIFVKHRERARPHAHTHTRTYVWPSLSDGPGGFELRMLRAAAHESKKCLCSL